MSKYNGRKAFWQCSTSEWAFLLIKCCFCTCMLCEAISGHQSIVGRNKMSLCAIQKLCDIDSHIAIIWCNFVSESELVGSRLITGEAHLNCAKKCFYSVENSDSSASLRTPRTTSKPWFYLRCFAVLCGCVAVTIISDLGILISQSTIVEWGLCLARKKTHHHLRPC